MAHGMYEIVKVAADANVLRDELQLVTHLDGRRRVRGQSEAPVFGTQAVDFGSCHALHQREATIITHRLLAGIGNDAVWLWATRDRGKNMRCRL